MRKKRMPCGSPLKEASNLYQACRLVLEAAIELRNNPPSATEETRLRFIPVDIVLLNEFISDLEALMGYLESLEENYLTHYTAWGGAHARSITDVDCQWLVLYTISNSLKKLILRNIPTDLKKKAWNEINSNLIVQSTYYERILSELSCVMWAGNYIACLPFASLACLGGILIVSCEPISKLSLIISAIGGVVLAAPLSLAPRTWLSESSTVRRKRNACDPNRPFNRERLRDPLEPLPYPAIRLIEENKTEPLAFEIPEQLVKKLDLAEKRGVVCYGFFNPEDESTDKSRAPHLI